MQCRFSELQSVKEKSFQSTIIPYYRAAGRPVELPAGSLRRVVVTGFNYQNSR